jgi:hypothetical protein
MASVLKEVMRRFPKTKNHRRQALNFPAGQHVQRNLEAAAAPTKLAAPDSSGI